MKIKLQSMLFLFGATFISFMGCKKQHEPTDSTITETFTSKTPTKDGATYYGTFTATGGLTTSGTSLMDVQLTADSSFCHDVLTTLTGTFTMVLNCSRTNMTGHWKIVNGTGEYSALHGNGPLTMMFPPNVPDGVLIIETITGKIL